MPLKKIEDKSDDEKGIEEKDEQGETPASPDASSEDTKNEDNKGEDTSNDPAPETQNEKDEPVEKRILRGNVYWSDENGTHVSRAGDEAPSHLELPADFYV